MGWSNSTFQVVIITGSTGSGLFVYSPAPGFGKLVASVVASAGTDPFGNAYVAGVTSYTGGNQAASLSTGELVLWTAAGAGGPWLIKATLSFIAGSVNLDAGLGTNAGININADGTGIIVAQSFMDHLVGAQVRNGLIVDTINASGLATLAGGIQSTPPSGGDRINISGSTGADGGIFQVVDTLNTGAAPSRFRANRAGDPAIGIDVVGDTNRRMRFDTEPAIFMGSGSAPPDVNLYRAGAGAFASNDIQWDNAGVGEVWNAVTFANSWVNAGTPPNLQYRRVAAPDNCVQLAGRIVAPAGLVLPSNITAALPVGYRPTHTIQFAAWDVTQQTPTLLQLGTGGVISAQAGAAILAGDTVELMGGPLIPLTA